MIINFDIDYANVEVMSEMDIKVYMFIMGTDKYIEYQVNNLNDAFEFCRGKNIKINEIWKRNHNSFFRPILIDVPDDLKV